MSAAIAQGEDAGRVALAALFVTALVTAQLTATKVLAIPVPGSYTPPVVGNAVLVPGAVLAYALTFFASDCYAELYGKRAAQVMVNVAFTMNFVVLALVWFAILAPAQDPGSAGQFRAVLGAGTNVVAGSLLAYLVSQNWDVVVFHRVREATDGSLLWLRNVVSTGTSQAIDTAIFVTVAFYAAPIALGLGSAVSQDVLIQLLLGQYLVKLLIALADTPFVYAVVAVLRGRGTARAAPSE